jgi:hypothetical protein
MEIWVNFITVDEGIDEERHVYVKDDLTGEIVSIFVKTETIDFENHLVKCVVEYEDDSFFLVSFPGETPNIKTRISKRIFVKN